MKKALTVILLVLTFGLFMSCNADADETLFGNYKSEPPSNEFTVTFSTNGGSTITSQTVQAGEKATKPTENPTKDGHIFDKWYSDEALTTEYDFDTPVLENITLYAKWKLIPFCFVAETENAKVKLITEGNPDIISLEYSTDGETYSEYTIGSEITSDNIGDRVYFRAKTTNANFSRDNNNYYYFVIEGYMCCKGNVMYLLDSQGSQTTVSDYAFCRLFYDCAGLTTVPKNFLPVTNLSEGCYCSMFYGCSGLTAAPDLPATNLSEGCYREMFKNCESLEATPALPATNLAKECYKEMFMGCTSLSTAPALDATSLEEACYNSMFSGCMSLKTAPELPALTMAVHCYNRMFYDCSSLETAPALNSTALASWCYKNMFYGCISLTTAPELPATALADYCYESMFQGCTSLTTAPELPATTLSASFCYSYMFSGCTNLSSVTVRLTSWNGNATENWLQGVAATGTFTCPSGLPETRDVHHIPNGWNIFHL